MGFIIYALIFLEYKYDRPIGNLLLDLGRLCSWTSKQVRNNIPCGLSCCEGFNDYGYTCCVALISLLISALRSYTVEFESGKATLSVVAAGYLNTNGLTEKLPGILYMKVFCPLFT